MKRYLIKQMRNEWRDNIWLVVGLTIVSLAIWWLSLTLYTKIYGLFYAKGFDTEDVYKVYLNYLPKESANYEERGEEEKASLDSRDMRMIIANIRNSPYVEVAAFSRNGLPYSYSYWGNMLKLEMVPEDTIGYHCNLRFASPEIVRVLRVKSRTGKSEKELEKMLQNGEILISNVFKSLGDNFRRPEELLKKMVTCDEANTKVGDIIDHIRRSDYEVGYGGMALIPIDESGNFFAQEIAIRMKPGMGEKFREEFENTPAMQSYGNFYASKLTKMSDEAKSVQKSESTEIRMGIILIIALIVIIGLGMIGVFWFRMQQRISEIAIRKVCGANARDILRRVITEGLLLLLMASLLAAAIGWPLLKHTLMKEDAISVWQVLTMEFATVAIVGIGIVVSLWWPARRAMRIEPAIAIKDE